MSEFSGVGPVIVLGVIFRVIVPRGYFSGLIVQDVMVLIRFSPLICTNKNKSVQISVPPFSFFLFCFLISRRYHNLICCVHDWSFSELNSKWVDLKVTRKHDEVDQGQEKDNETIHGIEKGMKMVISIFIFIFQS